MAISLPSDPSGEQYEDYVTSCLRTLGYFVETRQVLREGGKEVLELDVVTTPVGGSVRDRILHEVKKDGISFPNVFKLYGQRLYLQIDSACIVSLKDADPSYRGAYDQRGSEMGVRICAHPLDPALAESLATARNALDPARRQACIAAAWFGQIGRRVVAAAFAKECRKQPAGSTKDKAREYAFNVGSSFFAQTALSRAEALYSAYFVSPKLAGDAVAELASTTNATEQAIWNTINDDAAHPWIQHLMITETVARIAIVKNALDDLVERGGAPPPTREVKLGKWVFQMPLHELPARFKEGLEILKAHPHATRLPYLFQTFIEIMGGFLFFRDEDELQLLEDLAGVPKAEIVPALKLLDHFFAPEGGTFFYKQKDQLLCLKMVPGVVRGCGSFVRRRVFSLKEYSDRYVEMGWLLGRWHNALYNSLEPSLKAP